MEELHITDASTNGDTIHVRQYESESGWTVEVCGHNPKLVRQLLATGATQRSGYDSVMVDASTEQLIQFLASATGYRCKLAKKVKRQYSDETKLAMAERLREIRSMKTGTFVQV